MIRAIIRRGDYPESVFRHPVCGGVPPGVFITFFDNTAGTRLVVHSFLTGDADWHETRKEFDCFWYFTMPDTLSDQLGMRINTHQKAERN